MPYTLPQVADFKARFVRDFPYHASDATLGVLDTDIASAFVEANMLVNPDLFDDQGSFTYAYLLLAAHALVQNIRASSGGLSGGIFSFLESSKSVGSLSQSLAIPERILAQPELAALCTTHYGGKYLQLVLPQLAGNVALVGGYTQA